MRFEGLLKQFSTDHFPYESEHFHPEKKAVLNVREAVSSAINSDDFICDCIDLEIDRLNFNEFSTGLVPFYTIPQLGIKFALGYWSPGSGVAPHEHTAWTITAVCSNKLEVITYNRDESYKSNSLVSKRRFEGLTGMTGFIYEPCIHAPRNVSKDWSLTFHVVSPLDGQRPGDYREPLSCLANDEDSINPQLLAHPYLNAVIAGQKLQFADQLINKLLTINSLRSRAMLVKCMEICSVRTRRELETYLTDYISKDFSGSLLFEITDNLLELQCTVEENKVNLSVTTPENCLLLFSINTIGKEAIQYIVKERTFNAGQLPGLTKQEGHALAETLEETGVFKRIKN